MTGYRRNFLAGGSFFFTVNLAERQLRLLADHIAALRAAFRDVRRRHPFEIDAIVVLPDHPHATWTLPRGDADFAVRWRLIKSAFSRSLPAGERISGSRAAKGERGIWQRRYWEYTIRDERDFARHIDYIHINPVKHGYVSRVVDWPYARFDFSGGCCGMASCARDCGRDRGSRPPVAWGEVMNRTTPLDDWPNPPSLQKLLEECDGYHKISPERWAEFDAAMEMWKVRVRAGELHRIELTDTGRMPTTKAERAA